MPNHSYEEIRDVVIDILLGREKTHYEPDQWTSLTAGVAEVFARRAPGSNGHQTHPSQFQLSSHDAELARDVFWDLFRQGLITLGMNDSNPDWPFFRLSHTGERTLGSGNPYRFHNTSSFLVMVKAEVPDISAETLNYLDEAVATYYADCRLAACVMLGVAAEAEFLRLVEIAIASATHGNRFAPIDKERFIRTKINRFQAALQPILSSLVPKKNFEDLDTNLSLIQSVLRIARNDAGHPSGATPPEREQVYVYLQMFVPFARQLMHLRTAL